MKITIVPLADYKIVVNLIYGYHPTPFGECLIAISNGMVCKMAFVDKKTHDAELLNLTEKYKYTTPIINNEVTQGYINRIFNLNDENDSLELLVKGTPFQLLVWEALLTIPLGTLTTYEHIAKSIENPKALRAVGTAIGANPIAYLIPCHRVINKSGKTGNYRWGAGCKQQLIELETKM